jgi:hypothetical protein
VLLPSEPARSPAAAAGILAGFGVGALLLRDAPAVRAQAFSAGPGSRVTPAGARLIAVIAGANLVGAAAGAPVPGAQAGGASSRSRVALRSPAPGEPEP